MLYARQKEKQKLSRWYPGREEDRNKLIKLQNGAKDHPPHTLLSAEQLARHTSLLSYVHLGMIVCSLMWHHFFLQNVMCFTRDSLSFLSMEEAQKHLQMFKGFTLLGTAQNPRWVSKIRKQKFLNYRKS